MTLLIVDDLLLSILEGIVDQANRAHLEYLRDHLKGITFEYERGVLSREEFEKLRSGVLAAIDACSLHLDRRQGARPSLEFGL